MSARSRSRRRRKDDRRAIIWGVLILAVVAAAAAGSAWFVATAPKPIDSATLCPADGPRGHYVVLVDRTDPMTFVQRKAFKTVFDELVQKRLPEGYLLTVFSLDENFEESADPLVELCNPGTGDDKSEFTANVRKIKRQYQERFIAPLHAQVDEMLPDKPAKSSPILEMIQLASINGFRRHRVDGERRLIIVSDMMHNTPQFTMYRRDVDFDAFSGSSTGRRLLAELHGVRIELHYLMNAPQFQTRRHIGFWERYFDNAGARLVEVRPMEG